ncbi:Hypothetical protein PHPALM_4299 [Phytophthora palmivora]|uniref:Knr4/Smi1-like domain-containing protein n=1 Tax=Phytophthora palmivora TaxID=4796 RepID=A0A2P4YK48_9STRA|nr:Hypothetical protein PHPALM_4299 [Phytophthora palmivora]
MSGVQVVADGNPRQGGMDVDERDQCIRDIVSWFQRKADLELVGEKNAHIEALEKTLGMEIPEELRSLLTTQSGGIWFDDYKDIINKVETLGSVRGWDSSFIPFAANVDGGALVTDTNSRNAVFEFNEDGKGDRPLAPSLLEYLEKYRNRLLSGKFDYVEDVGLVERSRK